LPIKRKGMFMKVKRIFAPDMRQAMKRVRDEIGPQAVIVSNHRIAGGVEVVAAHEQDFEHAQSQFKEDQVVKRRREDQIGVLTGRQPASYQSIESEKESARNAVLRAKSRSISEYADQQPEQLGGLTKNKQLEENYDDDLETILASLKKRKDGQKQAAAPVKDHRPIADKTPLTVIGEQDQHSIVKKLTGKSNVPAMKQPVGNDALIENMQQEIENLKKMLGGQLPGAYRSEEKSVSNSLVIDKLSLRFEQIGLPEVFEKHIKGAVNPGLDLNKAWRKSLAQLVDLVPVVNYDFMQRAGMIAFVGPTGVGKTTTIGKLAAKYVLENGSAGVALVTTDSYRIAAHEQLKTFAKILDIPVRVVDEKNSLASVLDSLRNKRLVLIDTAGLGAGEVANRQQSEMLESVGVNVKKLLVLSCSSQKQVLDDALDNYGPLGLNGCVLTKVDESGSMGAALTLVTERKLPVAYVATGQKVPDDIHVANKNDLVSRAVLAAQKSREREKIRKNAAL
jgi:flagellar biosynthesis protein FlhF